MKKLSGIIGVVIFPILLCFSPMASAFDRTVKILVVDVPPFVDPGDEQDPGVAKITKNFAVNSSDKVILSNQYGTLNVRTWSKNEVRLDVMVYGSPDLDSRQLSEMVSVNAVKRDGAVLLETRLIGSKRKNGKKIRVQFQVYMPETNNLALSHQYGNVNIGDFRGSVVAKVQYGNFVAGDLKGEENDLSIRYGSTVIKSINKGKISQEYGSGLTIGTANTLSLSSGYAAVVINSISDKADITQRYGAGLTISTVGQLNLKAAYAKIQIGTIRVGAKLSHQYSDLTVGTANGVELFAQYSNVSVGRLTGDGKIQMQYNNLDIGDVSAGCQSLSMDCAYVKAYVKFNNSFNGTLEVSTANSSFKYGPRVFVKTEGENQNKRFIGRIGSGGNSKVRLASRYGSAVFN